MSEETKDEDDSHFVSVPLSMKSFSLPKGTESNPVKVSAFVEICEKMSANHEFGFEQEFEGLPMKYPYEQKFALDNMAKNRYEDIYPYDHSRVVLKKLENEPEGENSTYINASYFDKKQYIGSQGPLPETITDFWRMVWEQNTRIIAMVTNLEENHSVKCSQYWPSKIDETLRFGDISVTLLEESFKPEFVVRSLQLTHHPSNTDIDVYQCHYVGWPDKGVPVCTFDVLDYIVYCRHLQTAFPYTGPIVVHCSAGVGRSGTFVILDRCMQSAQENKEIDVVENVVKMRKNRMWSVQTMSQYSFVYKAIRDHLIRDKTDFTRNTIIEYVKDIGLLSYKKMAIVQAGLAKRNNLGSPSKLTLEYQELLNIEKKVKGFLESGKNSAKKKYNIPKNSDMNCIPYESARVVLDLQNGAAGTDYINATWINGYESSRCYCIMPTPIPFIYDDFWRMVYQHNICDLILIGNENNVYWPSILGESETYGHIHVNFASTSKEIWFVKREFEISNLQQPEKKARKIRQFHFIAWSDPAMPPPPSAMRMFFCSIRGDNPNCSTDEERRTCVQSKNASKAACYMLFDMVCRSLFVYNHANVLTTAKRIRYRRAGLIATEMEYQYVYQCTVNYVEYLFSLNHRIPDIAQTNEFIGRNRPLSVKYANQKELGLI